MDPHRHPQRQIFSSTSSLSVLQWGDPAEALDSRRVGSYCMHDLLLAASLGRYHQSRPSSRLSRGPEYYHAAEHYQRRGPPSANMVCLSYHTISLLPYWLGLAYSSAGDIGQREVRYFQTALGNALGGIEASKYRGIEVSRPVTTPMAYFWAASNLMQHAR